MKRTKQPTKRERKALAPPRPPPKPKPLPAATTTTATGDPQANMENMHIHCVACGRHVEPKELKPPVSAFVIECEHKSQFVACTQCLGKAKDLLDEHDRTGQPVKAARAWH